MSFPPLKEFTFFPTSEKPISGGFATYQSGRKAPVLQGGDIRRVKAGSFVAQRIA
jgi:hypothetical protein